jgi:hypothetical protein
MTVWRPPHLIVAPPSQVSGAAAARFSLSHADQLGGISKTNVTSAERTPLQPTIGGGLARTCVARIEMELRRNTTKTSFFGGFSSAPVLYPAHSTLRSKDRPADRPTVADACRGHLWALSRTEQPGQPGQPARARPGMDIRRPDTVYVCCGFTRAR